MRFSAMGDVAMTVPVVKALAEQYPDLRITFLSREFARAFYTDLSPNVGFMSADFRNEYRGVHGLNVLYRRLRAKHFTSVADFHDVLRSKYLRWRFSLSLTPTAHVDKHRCERRNLTRKGALASSPLPSVFDNYADVLARLGYPIVLDKTANLCGDVSVERVRNRIGFAPFAAHQGKILPLETTQHFLSVLDARGDVEVYLFSGRGVERDQVKDWCSRYRCCVDASSLASSLSDELSMMKTLSVMVSMDSANMHLASLVDTPVVSIWGATHPSAGFLGWNQSLDDVVEKSFDCRPCSIYGNRRCRKGDYPCLRSITSDDILTKIIKYIS